MSVQILAAIDASAWAPAVFDAEAEMAFQFDATLDLLRSGVHA
jgi:hypothetical protein